jgi:hypothetical protein
LVSEAKSSAAFLTPANLRAIGKNLQRAYPVDDARSFDGLLKALDQAVRKNRSQ